MLSTGIAQSKQGTPFVAVDAQKEGEMNFINEVAD